MPGQTLPNTVIFGSVGIAEQHELEVVPLSLEAGLGPANDVVSPTSEKVRFVNSSPDRFGAFLIRSRVHKSRLAWAALKSSSETDS